MSAPVLLSDMLAQASTVWLITDSIVAGTPGAPKKKANFPLPMRSSSRRISGWKMIKIAMRPSSTMRWNSDLTIFRLSRSEITSTSSTNTIPRASRMAFVFLISPMRT